MEKHSLFSDVNERLVFLAGGGRLRRGGGVQPSPGLRRWLQWRDYFISLRYMIPTWSQAFS